MTFTITVSDQDATTLMQALCAAGGFAEVTQANATQAIIDWMQATYVNVMTPRPATPGTPVTPPVLT